MYIFLVRHGDRKALDQYGHTEREMKPKSQETREGSNNPFLFAFYAIGEAEQVCCLDPACLHSPRPSFFASQGRISEFWQLAIGSTINRWGTNLRAILLKIQLINNDLLCVIPLYLQIGLDKVRKSRDSVLRDSIHVVLIMPTFINHSIRVLLVWLQHQDMISAPMVWLFGILLWHEVCICIALQQ